MTKRVMRKIFEFLPCFAVLVFGLVLAFGIWYYIVQCMNSKKLSQRNFLDDALKIIYGRKFFWLDKVDISS